MDSHSPTGGTMEATRSLSAVVIEGSLSSTMMTGKNLFFKERYNMREDFSLYFRDMLYWNLANSVCCGCSYCHCYQPHIIYNIYLCSRELNETLNTGLPGGTYCDVISGQKESGRCTGKQVTVGGDGRAAFRISNTEEDPFIAIHADSKL